MEEKRKISVRKILQLFTTLVVSAGCVVAMVGASKIEDNKPLKSVAIHIRNDKKYHFIEQNEIMDLVIKNRNIGIEHTPFSKLDIHAMEQVLLADPWVAGAEVYMDNDRVLHLYVTQRIPVARVFQQDKSSFYMDTTMNIMPLSKNNIYYTTVVTNVPELKDDSSSAILKKQIVSLVRTIQADSFWNAQVSQVIVDSNWMFELVPVLGNQKILFGDISGMSDKFGNLFAFYKNVLNRIGWDKYETLDLRFKGQVVASPSLPYTGPTDKAVVNMNWINSIVETEARNDSKDSVKEADAAAQKEKKVDRKEDKKESKSVAQAKPPQKGGDKKDAKKADIKKTGKDAPKQPLKPAAKNGKDSKDKSKDKSKEAPSANNKNKNIKDTGNKDKNSKGKDSKDKDSRGKDAKDKGNNNNKDKKGNQASPKYVYPEKKDN